MPSLCKIGFLGGGNMAGAIIKGILGSALYLPETLCVFDISKEKLSSFADQGLSVAESEEALLSQCDTVFLCVKPQVAPDILGKLRDVSKGKLFITIMAGISSGYISELLGGGVRVVRAMPNTPLLLGAGTVALSAGVGAEECDVALAETIFSASGSVYRIPEEKMNDVIPVNGSSPAFFYLFAKYIADFGQACGFDRQASIEMAASTMIGSGKMMLESGYSPEELIRMVSSPGGTTLKGLEAFYQSNLEHIVQHACEETAKRAYELGK